MAELIPKPINSGDGSAQNRSAAFSPILQAALDAFYENGYHGSTVRDIARRVGVTVPALYYHHQNKEAMLFALLDGSITHLLSTCRSVASAQHSEAERFSAVVEVLVRYSAVSGRLTYLDSEFRSLTHAHQRAYSAKRSAIEGILLTTVEQGSRDKQFALDFPKDSVRALLGMIQAIPTWFHLPGPLTVDDLVVRYLRIADRVVGARSDLPVR